MSEKNERVFRGVWVPVEIWESQSLSWMEKCLWAEISSLGTEEKPCFASNGYLAKMFHSTESSISNMISKLRSLKMIKQISYDGRSRKILAVLPSQTSPTSEVRVHPQVKSDSTHRCNQSQPAGELRLNPQVNIDTKRETSRDTKGEFKPLTPFQGEEESSAVASHSSVELNQPNLFPTEITANAKVSFATAHFNDPPNMANAKTTAARKKSPPTNIPTELDTPEFNTAWNEFLQHRKEKRAPMTPTAQKNMFGKFTTWGVESAVAAIDAAISNGWTGVFEPKQNKSNSKPEKWCNI